MEKGYCGIDSIKFLRKDKICKGVKMADKRQVQTHLCLPLDEYGNSFQLSIYKEILGLLVWGLSSHS